MGDAVWLFFGLPQWFFSNLVDPFAVIPLSVVPFVGSLCLAAGLLLGYRKRARFLGWFALPCLASQALVAVAGFLRGGLDSSQSMKVLLPYLVVILVWSAVLVVKAKGARFAAVLLGGFTLSYAAYAAFVSGMSFADSWL